MQAVSLSSSSRSCAAVRAAPTRVRSTLPALVRARGAALRAKALPEDCTGGPSTSASAAAPLVAMQLLAPLVACGAAFAEDVEAAAAVASATDGFQLQDYILAAMPILSYGVFNIYRAQVNPKASFWDFVTVAAAVVVLYNIISIVVFKVRYF